MATTKANSSVQLSLFPCQGTSVNDARNGSNSAARLSTYLHSKEGLWRLLACFPPTMPVVEALRQAQTDFTKARKEVVL